MKLSNIRALNSTGFSNNAAMFNASAINYLDDEERLPILADEDTWTRYMNRYPVGDVCKADCDLMYREHYHCITGIASLPLL